MKIAIRLCIIAAVSAGLLWGANTITSPVITTNAENRQNEAYNHLADFEKLEKKEFESGEVTTMATLFNSGQNNQYIFTASGNNNYGNVTLMVLIKDDLVENVLVTSNTQTPSFYEKVNKDEFFNLFKGDFDKTATVDTQVGATFAATTIKELVQASIDKYGVEVLGNEEVVEKEVVISEVPNGTYNGKAAGFGGDIELNVTVLDGKITDIEYISKDSQNDGYGDDAFDNVKDLIIKDNSISFTTPIDTVTGGTVSTNGIVEAVKNALTNLETQQKDLDISTIANGVYIGSATGFGGDINVEVSVNEGKINSIFITNYDENTDGIGDDSYETISNNIISKNSIEVDGVAGATSTSNGLINAVKNALTDLNLKVENKNLDITSISNGVYVGTSKGFGGDIKVEVSVNAGKIENISIVNYDNNTDGIGDNSYETISKDIISKNSVEVDGVAGATSTSNGLINAVKNALTELTPKGGIDISTIENGTYEGTGLGFNNDEIKTKVTVLDGKITNIEYVTQDPIDNKGDNSYEELKTIIIEKNSIEVDTIAGGTKTSKGIIESITNALTGGKA